MKQINQSYDFQRNDMKNAIAVNMIVEARPFDPATAEAGQIYYNSGMKLLRVYDGIQWKSLTLGAGVMVYRGTVTDWSELPISGMQGGDYWVNSTTQTARVWNSDTSMWDDVGNATFTVDSAMSETSTNALQNRIVTQEMLQRLKKFGNEPVSGEPYRFIYFIGMVPESDKVKVTAYAMTLDNTQSASQHTLDVPAADIANDKAGLYTKALADRKADVADINKKLDKLDKEPVSGEPYHFPFNINPIVQESNRITTTFDTITLDGNGTKVSYPIVIPSADPTNDKSGLYTKALADAKENLVTYGTALPTTAIKGDLHIKTVGDKCEWYRYDGANWVKITGAVIDNLTSTSSTDPLSAKQGKELNENKQDKSTLENDVSAKGFTKNVGTITGIKMNGSSKGTGGVVDLGTVLTEHQSLDGYATNESLNTGLASKQNIASLDTDVGILGYTKNVGTIEGITMNGESKGTSGVVDLGTVLTEHQDISGKADRTELANYLPLTGGNITGDLTIQNHKLIRTSTSYSYIKHFQVASGATNNVELPIRTTCVMVVAVRGSAGGHAFLGMGDNSAGTLVTMATSGDITANLTCPGNEYISHVNVTNSTTKLVRGFVIMMGG